MKARKLFTPNGTLGSILFWCPGCEEAHTFDVNEVKDANGNLTYPDGPHKWRWNGDLEKPTFSPSLLYLPPSPRCHLFLKAGVIDFLSDCVHKLAGQKVPLADIPKESGWAGKD